MHKYLTRKDVLVILIAGAAPAATFVLAGAVKGRLAFPASLAAASGLLAGLAVYSYRSLLHAMQFHRDQTARQDEHLYRQLEALLQIQNVIQCRLPLPGMRGWAISPDFASLLASEILRHKPGIVVELGCGTSTLISAYCLEKLGRGRVLSLDHERKYAEVCRENVKEHGLEEFATVLDTRLCDLNLESRHWKYYDVSPLRRISPIEVLVVDGPPATLGRLARYPALPLLYNQLGENAVILVDDTIRADDRRMVEMWAAEYPDFECTFLNFEEGAAVLRRRPGRAGRNGQ